MSDMITIRAEGATVWIGDRRLTPGDTCEVTAARRPYYEAFPTITVVEHDANDDSLKPTQHIKDDVRNKNTK